MSSTFWARRRFAKRAPKAKTLTAEPTKGAIAVAKKKTIAKKTRTTRKKATDGTTTGPAKGKRKALRRKGRGTRTRVLFGPEYRERLLRCIRPRRAVGGGVLGRAIVLRGPFVNGVDPGTREFAGLLYDVGGDNLVGIYWCDLLETMALWGTSNLCATVNEVVARRPAIFREDARMVVEPQVHKHTDNCIVESTIRTLYHGRGVLDAPPKDLKKHYDAVRFTEGRSAKKISTREYIKSILKPHEKALFASLHCAKLAFRKEAIAVARERGETEPKHLTATMVDQYDVFAMVIMAVEKHILHGPVARRVPRDGQTTPDEPLSWAMSQIRAKTARSRRSPASNGRNDTASTHRIDLLEDEEENESEETTIDDDDDDDDDIEDGGYEPDLYSE